MKIIKECWNWLGSPKNYKPLVLILMLIAALIALWGKLDNQQGQINIIKSDINDLYNRQVTEEFSYSDLLKFNPEFNATDENHYFQIPLKHEPVPNSLNLWFFGSLVEPTQYNAVNNIITIEIDPQFDDGYFISMQDYVGNTIVVVYTKTN